MTARCLITVEKAADVLRHLLHPTRANLLDAPSETPVSADEIKRLKGLGFLNNKGTNNSTPVSLPANGRITTAQARCIADAAALYGSGQITMTTRLSQEVIGVEYDKIPDFIAYLAKEGLETGGTGAKIRPVVSS